MRVVVAILAFLASPALAQPASIPRTADGKPDFQGNWFTGFVTFLERPDGLAEFVIAPDKHAEALKLLTEMLNEGEVYDPEFDTNGVPPAMMTVGGEMRSSWLVDPVDGKLPLTSLAKASADKLKRGFDDPESRPGAERCIDGVVNAPMPAAFLLIPMQVVQTRDAVVIAMEDLDPARIVSFDAAIRPEGLRTRGGQSRGRWEGDTLVIETDRLAIAGPDGFTSRGGALITADSRVVERLRLIDRDTILYQFTVEDPSLYSRPWLAEYEMKRIARPVYEYACHEGNQALINILLAARLGRQEPAVQ